MSLLAVALLVVGSTVAQPALPRGLAVDVQKTPRLVGKADVALWHSLDRERVVFGKRRPVWVRASTPRAGAALSALGVRVGLGQWVLTSLDGPGLLSAVSAGEGIELASAPMHRPLLQQSLREIGAPSVYMGKGLELPRTGQGVLVGLVDTGIDLWHPAFRDKNGRSRVVAVWDQDAEHGRTPERYGYGAECSASELRQDNCDIGDPSGHGTHVAGIAGGGQGVLGVAPDADLAIVRSNDFTRIADAVDYLIRLADRRDEPLVINVSVGGQYGPRDGRTPLERWLSDRLGPGRVLVAAAGNDGNGALHAGHELTEQPVRMWLRDLPYGRPTETLVEMWTRPEAPVELTLELWQEDERVLWKPLSAHDSELAHGVLSYDGQALGQFTYGVDLATEHNLARRTLVLDFSEYRGLPSGATLALAVSGRGRLDAWVSQSDYRYGEARFGASRGADWIGGDGARSLTVPATCSDVIAVGSYTTRNSWVNESGETITHDIIGALAPYSSRGPTLFPQVSGIKPNIAAPGSIVISARALSVPTSNNTVDAEQVAMQGTSMASPHVAGVVALMLEANPQLGPTRTRMILEQTARADAQTGAVPNDAWGYGRVDALAAVRLAEQTVQSGCAQVGLTPWLVVIGMMGLLRRRTSRRGRS